MLCGPSTHLCRSAHLPSNAPPLHRCQARDPIDQMISYLQEYFDPTDARPERSLAISNGDGGARLTHSHARQYAFVFQSLSLWREIANDMFRLWYVTRAVTHVVACRHVASLHAVACLQCLHVPSYAVSVTRRYRCDRYLAEDDLLRKDNRYEQRDTGQGLQRVQTAARTARAMQQLLHATQTKCGEWVGSSLVHLGDSNVPNALMFIDKYSQIEHILQAVPCR